MCPYADADKHWERYLPKSMHSGIQLWVFRWSDWDSLPGRTSNAIYEALPKSPGFFLGWWQWSACVYASFIPSRSWQSLVTPACPTSVSPSLDTAGKLHTDKLGSSWAANPHTVSSCCAQKPFPAASSGGCPTKPSRSCSIPVLMFLLQFSACWCKIQQTLFVLNFVKIYTNLSYLGTNTAPFSLNLLWKWLSSDAKINFPAQ